jgi:hypothetical protein
MSRGERTADVPVLIIDGVERAFKLYKSWTRGHWLWYAPEYLITIEVARSLADGLKSRMIELEYSVKAALSEAGATHIGRPRKALRGNGRYDIVLSRKSGAPWFVIEIKRVSNHTNLRADIERIHATLLSRDAKIQGGVLAFYVELEDKTRKTAADRIKFVADGAVSLAEKVCGGTFKVQLFEGKLNHSAKDRAGYQAFCLVFSRRS